MFRPLLKKQLMELLAPLYRSKLTGKRRGGIKAATFGLLAAALLALLMVCFGSMALPLAAVLAPRGLGWMYFAVMELSALTLGTAAASFVSYSALFNSKDNELLLSLPLPPRYILAARLVSVGISCLLYTLLALVPAEAVWLHYAPREYAPLIGFLPAALSLCCAGTALACAVGWAAAVLSAHMRHKSAAAAAATLVFFAAYMWGFRQIENALSALLAEAMLEPEPLRQRAGALYWLGSAACGDTAALLAQVLASAGFLAAFCALLSRRYFALISASRAVPKAEQTPLRLRVHSPRAALLLREWRRFSSSAPYLVNGALCWLLVPLMGAAVLLEPDTLSSLTMRLPLAVICAAMCMAAGLAPVAAPSVSLEGKTLWLLRSLPITPWQALRAKLELHLLITLPPSLFCAVCLLAVGGFTLWEAAFCIAELVLYALFAAQLGLWLGLLLPNLEWTSEAAVIKQSAASVLASLCGLGAAVLLGAFGTALTAYCGAAAALLICAAALAAADTALMIALRTRGTRHFENL